MAGLGLLIQVGLLLGWYIVPAMATLPWWMIFLPLLISGAFWTVFVILPFAVVMIAAMITDGR